MFSLLWTFVFLRSNQKSSVVPSTVNDQETLVSFQSAWKERKINKWQMPQGKQWLSKEQREKKTLVITLRSVFSWFGNIFKNVRNRKAVVYYKSIGICHSRPSGTSTLLLCFSFLSWNRSHVEPSTEEYHWTQERINPQRTMRRWRGEKFFAFSLGFTFDQFFVFIVRDSRCRHKP